ncbi:MAG: ComEA family DNA-binding protein [Planctomycetaceae bacterium]
MPADASRDRVLPVRAQRVLAVAVAASLTGMAAAFVALGGLSGRLIHHDAAPLPSGRFTVNVNEAGIDELAVLPGLGPATARRIVDHRREHGPFTSIDGLLDVPGIGPATLDEMRPHLRPIRRREAPP